MKKISAIIILLSVVTFAQVTPKKSLIEMKSEMKSSSIKLNENQLPGSSGSSEKKSVGLAILYSLLLPGMGELYAGNYQSGKYFTIAEAALWGTYIGINTYGNWQKDNYKKFAASNGGVTASNKDDDYYANIGSYKDIDQYNNDMSFNRDYGAMYDPNTQYFKWNTTEDRKKYRTMWISSENAYNNLRFAVGTLIVNRIVSAVNAWRATVSYNKRLNPENVMSFSVGVGDGISSLNGINLQMRTSF